MSAMTYVPEIDLMLRAERYGLLVQRADADPDAPHLMLALAEAVTMLESDVETKDATLEEAYAEHGRLEGIIEGKCADEDKLRAELEDAQGEMESMSEVIAELRARLARHAQGDAPDPSEFIRKLTSAERSSQKQKDRGWQALIDKSDGREVVFKPRGEQGPGFYFAAAPIPALPVQTEADRDDVDTALKAAG